MRKSKLLIVIICVVAFLLFMYVIDHPYFNFFYDKNDNIADDDFYEIKK
jgi:hypothetical protein